MSEFNKENRITQKDFVCTSCDFEDNADYNASQNISVAHTATFKQEIEEFIKKN